MYIRKTHYYHLKIGCNSSTNTRAKLIFVWGLFCIASAMGLPKLMVFGDSKIIIDWINNVSNLQVLELDDWCT